MKVGNNGKLNKIIIEICEWITYILLDGNENGLRGLFAAKVS